MFIYKWIRIHNKNKDQGMTLIEVIISLLIIMIVFVPLLASFATAGKANQIAKKNLYASELANNVMETVKVLGIEGVALQFYTTPSNFSIAQVSDFREDLTEGLTSSVKLDANGIQYFDSSRGTMPYVYQMTGVRQGTGSYDVSITFSSASYTTSATPIVTVTPSVTPVLTPALPNDYKYADLSAFNSQATALINPKSSGTDYDYLVKTYFKQLHESYYYDEWVNACEIVNNANDVIYRAYEQEYDEAIAAGRPTPTVPQVTPMPTPKATLNDSALNERITRNTAIEISKVTDSLSGNEKYNLNSYITYSFNNILNNGGAIEGVCTDPSSSVLTRNYAGYCDDVLSTDLKNVFFMYTPYGSVSDLSNEKVVINNLVPENFNIYLVVQAPETATFTAHLPVVLSGRSNTLNLYSQATLDVSGSSWASTSNSAIEKDRLLKELSAQKGRIYNITIHIYESGGHFTEPIQSLSSTIISE